MKRSRQLIVESVIIAVVLMLVALGGIESANIPQAWTSFQNPSSVQTQTDLSALALYYNNTLSYLAQGNYGNTSFYLDTFSFANIPLQVNQTAYVAIGEIASMNDSIPLAIADFANATRLISLKEFQNATRALQAGCAEAENANQSFTQFAGSTTMSFSNLGVPTRLYMIGESLVHSVIAGLISECGRLSALLSSILANPGGTNGNANTAKLLIFSPQSSIETGGYVVLEGNLTENSNLVGGQTVYFYFNGTYIGTASSGSSGYLYANLSIPFVYAPEGSIWAFASSNSTISLPSVTSNTLFFTILFNETQVVVGDPPAYYPTQNFSVSGNLSTKSGTPIPGAPMSVSFLDDTKQVYTNSAGVFGASFVIPPDTPNGIYDVYARFTPNAGAFGPSYNLTSIQIIREILNVSVSSPSLTFAGFSSEISGIVATKNGTLLPNASVLLVSPWGNYQGKSNSTGKFAISVPVPIWEFAFAKSVAVTVTPAEPFVESGVASSSLSLFNFLWIVIPGIIAGLGWYEAKNLGLLQDLIRRLEPRPRKEVISAVEESETQAIASETVARVIPAKTPFHRMISIYTEALGVILQKFPGISFKQSSTIREISDLVRTKAQESSSLLRASQLFQEISLATEEFLYSEHFDERLVMGAEAWLEELKSILRVSAP